MQELDGVIYQSISGFYYVWSQGKSYTTKPKGLFRHTQEKPLVGDRVKFEIDPNDSESESRLIEIYERKNELVRPSISNVDFALIVSSLLEPEFSYNLLDHFLVGVESQNIIPKIVLSKFDLLVEKQGQVKAEQLVKEIKEIYSNIGYSVAVFADDKASSQTIGNLIEEGVHVVMGQSGVGKSTILNYLLPEAKIETGVISSALNRGKHTTREVTLYPYNDGFVADTPGFSAIDFPHIEKEELRYYFPEIMEAGSGCQFRSCLHVNEPKCHVKELVTQGEIAESRYNNYLQIFAKIEERKPIYRKKN